MKHFESARLKFKARTGCLGIQEDLLRWRKAADGSCPICHNGIEGISHFMLICPILGEIRITNWSRLEIKLLDIDSGHIWEYFMGGSLITKLCFLLGDVAFDYGDEVGWLFDTACKSFLREAWAARKTSLEGTQTICD